MKIVSKEIDKYKSTKHKDKVISEYIIYLIIKDVTVEAHIEYGNIAKDARIKSISEQYNVRNYNNINN